MKKGKNVEDISKEFNNELISTGHFDTFPKRNLNSDNQNFLNNDDKNKLNIYSNIFSQTNPKNLNLNS